ncbi:type 2 periplasmic-binding domain-containing protein [Streptomyces odonnellii]|uniref:hypothetical protein n=1 Tax=Streptomyces odonnellii TaxID=1417980 RepID=UPI00069786BA|nr:hypothetical protein [Streptomyces odonnellii]
MNVKFRIRVAAAVGAAALGLSLFVSPASADSETRQIVGVGSAATQDVLNGLGNAIPDPDNIPDNQLIQSYDATGTTPVTCRSGGTIARPGGSAAGIQALRNDLTNPSIDCVDFARSSQPPDGVNTPPLTWIAFAKDAVTVAVRSSSVLNDGFGFTTAQLRDIYTCLKTTHNGIALKPLLPQAGSDVRAFFLGKIGVAESQVGACVNSALIPENDGTILADNGNVVPYSVPKYIAQTNGVVIDRHGLAVLTRVDAAAPRTANGKLNIAFPYNRDVFNVVPTARLAGGATPDADLISAFVSASSKVCAQTAVIEAYGFGVIANCGVTIP